MHATAIAAATLALFFSAPAVAWADPEAPQPNTPCPADIAEVMTWRAGDSSPLECLDNQWQIISTPQPPSDRWLSFGPPIALHGEGLRNPNVASGEWSGVPQDANSRCRAEQRAVVEAGVVGPPQVAESGQGQPLTLRVLPALYSIELSGYCLWTRTGA